MLAVDTNIVVRYLTNDDAVQAPAARQLVDTQPVFVSATVILETEWVLRKGYRFTPPQVADALHRFAGLPNVLLEEPRTVAQAIGWLRGGMDFADALHLAKMGNCDALISFDADFVAAAARLGTPPVRAP